MPRFFDETTNTLYIVSDIAANQNLRANDLSDNPLTQIPEPQNSDRVRVTVDNYQGHGDQANPTFFNAQNSGRLSIVTGDTVADNVDMTHESNQDVRQIETTICI